MVRSVAPRELGLRASQGQRAIVYGDERRTAPVGVL